MDVVLEISPRPADGTMVLEWLLDGQPSGSGQITGPSPPIGPYSNNFRWVWDTTGTPDGTHSVCLRVVDSSIPGLPPYYIRSNAQYVIIHNGGGPLNNGSQTLPLAPSSSAAFLLPPAPDFVTYPGTAPVMNTSSYPSQFAAPAANPTERTLLRDVSNWYCEDIGAIRFNEYDFSAQWRTTPTGGVFAQKPFTSSGLSIEGAYQAVLRHSPYDGQRHNNFVDPFSTFFPSLDDPDAFYAVNLSGGLYKIIVSTGEVITFAGWRRDRAKLPVDIENFVASEAEIFAQYEFIGTITDSLTPDQFAGLNDGCIDPRDHKVFYVTNAIDHFIIKVDTNFTPAHISRYAGQPGTHGLVDGNSLTTAQFYSPYTIVMSDGTGNRGPIGTLYVSDFNNWALRKISPDGLTVSTVVGKQTGKAPGVPLGPGMTYPDLENPALSDTWTPPGTVAFASAYIPTPMSMRFASGGDIVYYESGSAVLRRINLGASTVSRIVQTDNIRSSSVFVGIDVDTLGTCIQIDDIMIAPSGESVPLKIVSLDGSYNAHFAADGFGWTPEGEVGVVSLVFTPAVVYSWAVQFSRFQARFFHLGLRNPGISSFRKRLPGDPFINIGANIGFNQTSYDRGRQIYRRGTCLCFPWNSRPALTHLHGAYGYSQLGSSVAPTFDELLVTYPSDAALGAYIQGGMAGSISRPEITGRDLRDLIYFIRRVATSGSYPTPPDPGPSDPDVTAPIISSVVAIRLTSTSIRVTWTTNKPTIGMAVAGTAQGVGTTSPYHIWSPFETTFGTFHDRTIVGLPSVSPIHVAVVSKDNAGNFTNSADITVALSPDGSVIHGQPGGGADGTLYTRYGTWTLGSAVAPQPGYGGGTPCDVLLNGKPVASGAPIGIGISAMQQLRVNYGGNLYGMTFDQIWYQWVDNSWQGNNGADLASGPAPTPTPPALPTFNPPYTPSAENTSISGGVGSLQTTDGIWTFGAVNGSGWDVNLNGIPVLTNGFAFPPYDATLMTVYASSQLFFRKTDSTWRLWAGFQANPSTGPTASPVPVGVVSSPSNPSVVHTASIGTHIADIAVTMSDGSAFSGTITVNDTTNFAISGASLVTNISPLPGGIYFPNVTVSQNGSSYEILIDVRSI
jgi:hypothetical protein